MIEETLAALTAAITENTAVLREVLAAGGVTPTNVVPIQDARQSKSEPKEIKEAKKKAEKVEPVKAEPAAVVELEPEPAAEEAPTLDADALISEITETWKSQLAAADIGRKTELKKVFPDLRAKWGLEADAKLITLAPTPEKLAGLLADIKAL